MKVLGVILGSSLLVSTLAGCGGGDGPAPSTTIAQQQPENLGVCLDPTSSYPAALLARARNMVADAIQRQYLVAGSPGARITVFWITAHTRGSLVVGFKLPAVDRWPAPPNLNDPALKYDSRRRAALVATYQQDKAAVQAQIDSATATAMPNLDALRNLTPPDPDSSDIGGCLQKFSDAWRGIAGTANPERRTLIVASDWEPTGNQDLGSLTGATGLSDARIRGVFFYCARAIECGQRATRWTAILAQAGATNIQFLDADAPFEGLLDQGGN